MSERVWRDEARFFTDELSGRRILRLTDYKGHSGLLYFTDSYRLDAGRFIFVSDRNGASNLFLYDLGDYSIHQLTDFEDRHRPQGLFWPERGSVVFWYGNTLWELDPYAAAGAAPDRLRPILELDPAISHSGMHAASADGRSLFTAISPRRAGSGLNYGKSPAYLSSFANPDEHRIVVIDADTGAMETVHSERARIEHVNAAPGDPDLLTFCHEGPWARVAQRIWGLRVSTGETWPIRPQNGDLAVGHEYFVRGAAGDHWIGYHGRRLPEERVHTFGFVRSDNSARIEQDFPYHCTHFTSHGLNWALGDGTPANVQPWFRTGQRPFLMLFRRRSHSGYEKRAPDDGAGAAVPTVDDIRFDGPRVLAYHRSTFNEQLSHPHPQFTPDGRHVMFTSDVGGYANIYMVPVGEFEELPTVEDCRVEW